MTARTILFLCTGNSARSIMAEALVNHMGEGRFRAVSAGSQPKGAPNPMALRVLEEEGIDTAGLESKSWHVFAGPDAPAVDFIITVCDDAAGEECPVWPGRPIAAHWGIADPAAVEGEGKHFAFERALRLLRTRITLLLALSDENVDALALRTIGRSEGASEGTSDGVASAAGHG